MVKRDREGGCIQLNTPGDRLCQKALSTRYFSCVLTPKQTRIIHKTQFDFNELKGDGNFVRENCYLMHIHVALIEYIIRTYSIASR
jgi:hypothetical protein